MKSSRTNYTNLGNYLSNHPQLKDSWCSLSSSFSGEIMKQIGKYQKDPHHTLPPVYRLGNNQRRLYRETFQHLVPTYQALAIQTLGFPFQEKDNTQDVLDLLLLADSKTEWDFSIVELPINPMDLLSLSFKYVLLDAEAGQRKVKELTRSVEKLEKKYRQKSS